MTVFVFFGVFQKRNMRHDKSFERVESGEWWLFGRSPRVHLEMEHEKGGEEGGRGRKTRGSVQCVCRPNRK